MNIALIGTSPIMLLLASKLSNKNNVTIFENSKNYGGAWAYTKLGDQFIPAQTNMIIPKDREEQRKVNKINNYMFNNYGVNVFKVKNFSLIQPYKPKTIFIYELLKLYKVIEKLNVTIIKKKINSFYIKKNKVFLNKNKFDKIYLPYFSSIKNVRVNNKKFFLNHNSFKSKHLILLLKNQSVKNMKKYYIEKYDKVFDRMLFTRKKKLSYIIARIKKNYKNKIFMKLAYDTKLKIIKKKNNIIYKKYAYYVNNSRDTLQINKLNELNKYKQIEVVNTTQFVKSFLKLKLL